MQPILAASTYCPVNEVDLVVVDDDAGVLVLKKLELRWEVCLIGGTISFEFSPGYSSMI